MDYNGLPIQVGDVICFNMAESYHRDSYVFARVTKIQKNGRLDFDIFKTDYRKIHRNAQVWPNFNVIFCKGSALLKRGKAAGNGCYRYMKLDVTIYHYDPDLEYVQIHYD